MPLARLWVTLAAIALAGCNIAYSATPMLSAADGGSEPFLKHGLWESLEPCDKPQKAAECRQKSQRFVVTADSWRAAGKVPPGKRDAIPSPPYLAASGQPIVVQFPIEDTPEKHDDINYLFLGLAPLRRDPDGRITSAEWWIVQCGPPPRIEAGHAYGLDEREYATRAPLSGMKMVGTNCVPQDRAALLNAAAASRQWATDGVVTMTWLQASSSQASDRPE